MEIEMNEWLNASGRWLQAACKWLYDWVTVIAAVLIGGASVAFDAFGSATDGIDLSAILPSKYAMQIVTCIAIAKGLHAWHCACRQRSAAKVGGSE
jgi:hypothetical protein